MRSSAKCSHNERKILESLNQVLSKQSKILEEIESMKKVQDNIAQKVACFSVQLDDLALQIKQPEIEVQSLSQTSSKAESKPIYLKPIQNEEGLNDMERKLANNNTKETLFQSYSIVCNKGKAVDCAYAEIIFNRKFLCQCSWSGGSRGEHSKIPFKNYKNIITFFWSLIQAIDNKYTLKENEDFFKNLLKNSNKRLTSKNLRASTSRLRVKRKKLNIEVQATNANESSNCNETTDVPNRDETLNTAQTTNPFLCDFPNVNKDIQNVTDENSNESLC